MITENLSTLKIHKLSQAQYERELAAGRIDPNALYLTPDEGIDSDGPSIIDQLNGKADVDHVHDDLYYTETEINGMLDTMQVDIDSKVDAVDGMGLSTEDYTTAEKDKLATVEANANFYEHPTHASHNLGLYKVTVDDSGHVSSATLAEKEDIVALGIPEQDTTYEEEISDLSDRIDDVENSINTTNEILSGVSQEFESYKTTNNEAVSTNASGIEANKTAIEEIKSDYLTSTDKTQLQDGINEVSNKATANASAIEILNGEGDGSVKQSIDNAFNEFAANVTNDDVVNTYKELIDYAAEHGSEFATLVGQVDTIGAVVNEVKEDVADYKTETSDRFTEIGTDINNHFVDTNNPHGVTKEQVGLEYVDNTSDLEKPISNAVQSALDEKADLVHDHDDVYYTKDELLELLELLEFITVEDIDDICSNKLLITFTISDSSEPYQAEKGMTWEEWVNSSYNVDKYFFSNAGNNNIRKYGTTYDVSFNSVLVNKSDVIIENRSYGLNYSGNGGSSD